MTIDDMKKKAADRNAMPPKKSEIKIVDGRAASFDTKEADADIREGSAGQNNNAADEKNSVLKYMKDDSLFGRDNVSGGFGLEESSDFGSGYGVDGKILSAEVSGSGWISLLHLWQAGDLPILIHLQDRYLMRTVF